MTTTRRAPKVRLRCFVAMAFGHGDTDEVYDSIKKTLEPIGIDTIRVDRLEHNDDIDDRIIAEIKQADFVLADLTYARPSVYFEAGYAQRVVPVIFTARRDHFKAKFDDSQGNLRIHFDLQMRNIIGWSSARDETFLKRLNARVKRVVAPILAERRKDLEHKHQIAVFDRLSLQDRQSSVLEVGKKYFSRIGYSITELTFSLENTPEYLYPGASRSFWGAFVAMKRTRGLFQFVFFHVLPVITLAMCDLYRLSMIRHPLYNMTVFAPPHGVPKQLREDSVICSFGSGGFNRVRRAIPYMRTGDIDQTLVYDMPDFKIVRPGKQVEVPRMITFHLFESNRRLLALKDDLRERFPAR
jgi:nucleoside 2-deoxyribosyltransferase